MSGLTRVAAGLLVLAWTSGALAQSGLGCKTRGCLFCRTAANTEVCTTCLPSLAPSPKGDACYCAPGWYNGDGSGAAANAGKACVPCGANAYCPGGAASAVRKSCGPNTMTLGLLGGSPADCLALPGFGGASGRAEACAKGTYKGFFQGNAACTSCPAGLTTLGAASTSSDACSVLLPGYGAKAGARNAFACAANTYRGPEEVPLATFQVPFLGKNYTVEVASLDPNTNMADVARLRAQPWWRTMRPDGKPKMYSEWAQPLSELATSAPVASQPWQEWKNEGSEEVQRTGVFLATQPEPQPDPVKDVKSGHVFYAKQGGAPGAPPISGTSYVVDKLGPNRYLVADAIGVPCIPCPAGLVTVAPLAVSSAACKAPSPGR